MQDEKFIVLSILKDFLGEPKSSSDAENRNQWEFNCPSSKCKHDINKYNLAFNSEKNVYKCWKCKESGVVHKLVYKYGSSENYSRLELISPAHLSKSIDVFRKEKKHEKILTCPLPDGYVPITSEIKTYMHKNAYEYLFNERKISFEQMIEFKIGYTEIGHYRNRIIIPSLDEHGNINYFSSRTFLKGVKTKYYQPDSKAFVGKNVPDKYDIIFNEKNINWDLPVYLVEGVFDMFRVPNSIPMLGKTPSWLLISKLIQHKSTVVICLDEDAIKDTFEIYEQLSSMGIDVYFVDLAGLGDISYHYEKNGKDALVELLKTRKKINFFYKFLKILN